MEKRTGSARLEAVAAFAALALVGACAGDALSPVGTSGSAGAGGSASTMSPIHGARLFVNTVGNPARAQAESWRATRPADAAMMDRIASQPIARWLGDWNTDVRSAASQHAARAHAEGALPVFVAYNIPNRDCGGYSGGGSTTTAGGYRSWVAAFADGLRGHKSVVVLEPDAVTAASCLSQAQQDERFTLLADAVRTFKAAGVTVYIDAGHAAWLSDAETASRLTRAGIADADGFALNVSNFISTAANVAFGAKVSARTGGKHFIVDTGRNGAGGTADGQWCNPAGQALGVNPTTKTGHPLVDAFLWIKFPGESDGPCNGGPASGQWWAEYALGLAQRQ